MKATVIMCNVNAARPKLCLPGDVEPVPGATRAVNPRIRVVWQVSERRAIKVKAPLQTAPAKPRSRGSVCQ